MERLIKLYEATFGCTPTKTEAITGSGSSRLYFRLATERNSAIGVIGNCQEENNAFIGITRHFLEKGLPVPTIYNVSPDRMAYLQSDLGDCSLYRMLTNARDSKKYSDADVRLLETTIRTLPRMQIIGAQGMDLSLCYPTAKMDETSIHFDLNYFKYCFLKLIPDFEFDELRLENDFCLFCADIMKISKTENSLILRDCQARNIMMVKKNGQQFPYFIDYQNCRFGPKEYDLASFLWQSSAQYPQYIRKKLIDCYIDSLNELRPNVNAKTVYENLDFMVLFRIIQVLGAYGFRGFIEHKSYFFNSIPYAIYNLKEIIDKGTANPYPYLKSILTRVTQLSWGEKSPNPRELTNNKVSGPITLTVTIYSFSFKKGIPHDSSGNGGGYVFDCRSTHNPGKYIQYKNLTGLDSPVIKFLEEDGEILAFLGNVYPIVTHHVQRFIERGFTHLMICFGCTGGQHRSVYSAQNVAEHLRLMFKNINIHLIHREQNIDMYL